MFDLILRLSRKAEKNVALNFVAEPDGDLEFEPTELIFGKNEKISAVAKTLQEHFDWSHNIYLSIYGNNLDFSKKLSFYHSIADNSTIKVSKNMY